MLLLDSFRVLQRVVAASLFFGWKIPRVEEIVVEFDVEDKDFGRKTPLPIWFSKAFFLIVFAAGGRTYFRRGRCSLFHF